VRTQVGLEARAELVPDLADPFFFDHPLDHVPEMLLVDRLLDLVEQPAAGRVRVMLWFPRRCALGGPVELRADPTAAGTWSVLACSAGEPVCLGTVGVRPAGPGGRLEPTPAPVPVPAGGDLVHRDRPQNVLVGRIETDEAGRRRAAVLSSPDPDHHLTRKGGADRLPVELLEAARQATVMRALTDYGWSPDTRVSIGQLRADLPARVDRDVPLALRWSPGPTSGLAARSELDLVDAQSGPVGRVAVDVQGWTGPEWRRRP
jgi:hypothetical protein